MRIHEKRTGVRCEDRLIKHAENGIVDFLMIEAFLSRMKIERSEYEFVLDDDDYYAYKQRENIEIQVQKGAGTGDYGLYILWCFFGYNSPAEQEEKIS